MSVPRAMIGAMVSDLDFPRLGFLYDELPDTPHIPVSLDFDPLRGISMQVPFAPDYGAEYAAWFDPPYAVPKYLKYVDDRVVIHLMNCRVTRSRGWTSRDHGVGWLGAEYAVEDRDRNIGEYTDVHHVRTRIRGLSEAMTWERGDLREERDEDGTWRRIIASSEYQPDFPVGEVAGMTVSIKLNQSWMHGRDRTVLENTTWLHTSSDVAISLKDHLDLHSSFRDLLAIIYWESVDFSELQVQHDERPARLMIGDPIGPAWRPLWTIRPYRSRERSDNDTTESRPVGLRQAGAPAIKAWFTERQTWSRVVDPLLGWLFMERSTVEVALMQTSVAVEAYGYLLLMRDGLSASAAKHVSFADRLGRAVEDLPQPITALTGGTLDDLARRASAAYNGTKHANKPLPSGQESRLLAHTLAFVLRTRLLQEIGVSDEIAQGLEATRLWHDLRDGWTDLLGGPDA